MATNFAQTLSGIRQRRATGGRRISQNVVTGGGVPRKSPQLSAVSTGLVKQTQGPSGTDSDVIGRLQNKAENRQLEQFEADQEAQRIAAANQFQESQEAFELRTQEDQKAFDLSSENFATKLAALKAENAASLLLSQAAFSSQLASSATENNRLLDEAEAGRTAERKRIQDLISTQETAPSPVVVPAPSPQVASPPVVVPAPSPQVASPPVLADIGPGPISAPVSRPVLKPPERQGLSRYDFETRNKATLSPR